MHPKTIDSFPFEVLLLMLDELSSLDKVRSLSICKRWLEIFNGYPFLWRRLDLPQRNRGCHSFALDLFDRRSSSTLEEIKMDISYESQAVEQFLQILEKQRDTLRVLHLRADFFADETVSKVFETLNGLLDCRFARVHDDVMKVRLLTDGIDGENESNHHETGLKLKILWNPTPKAVDSTAHLLCNLVSFHSIEDLQMITLWTLLKQCCRTLKHLSIQIKYEPQQSFQDLDLSKLQVLELYWPRGEVPRWMKMPFSVTLVCIFVCPSLPSVSKIWLQDLSMKNEGQKMVDELAFRCPEVAEIVVENSSFDGKNCHLTSKDCQLYLVMLSQRRQNVAAGMTVDGVRMLNLKRLVVPFRNLTDQDLSALRELAEEVVDLNTQQRFIEVEV